MKAIVQNDQLNLTIRFSEGTPKANAICERVIGTLRRECLDYVIPLSENHLRRILKIWVSHYNCSRPLSSLGPDLPTRMANSTANILRLPRQIQPDDRIVATPILGGLHRDYHLRAA